MMTLVAMLALLENAAEVWLCSRQITSCCLFCRDGAAHLDQVCTIRSQLPSSVPIIANGNVISWSDVGSNRRLTGCQGIMSAEGLLDDPSLFNGGVTIDRTRLAMEYLDLVDQYPTTLKTVIFHVRRMCKEVLQRYQLLEDCLSANSVEEVRSVVQKAIDYDMRGKGWLWIWKGSSLCIHRQQK